MCVISGKIESVNNTKIFCGTDEDKKNQLTVYSNNINNITVNNVMILPVPFPDTVKFHDFSNYTNFFDDCEKCFEKTLKSKGLPRRQSLNCSDGMKELKVHNVGSYKASMAMNLSDLNRANPEYFYLSNEVKEYLAVHYNHKSIGFILCVLVLGDEKYHPFAYSHKILNNKVYIPTRHFHLHNENLLNNNSTYLNFGNNQMFANKFESVNYKNTLNDYNFSKVNAGIDPHGGGGGDDYADDWSHDIYLYNVTTNRNNYIDKIDKKIYSWTGENKLELNKINFDLDEHCKQFKKMSISGKHRNMDIFLNCV